MRIETKATVFDNNSSGIKPVQVDNQTVSFAKWESGKGISIFLTNGIISEPGIEIAFKGDQIERILEFLRK